MAKPPRIRTTEPVHFAGLWRNVCSRPGCGFVEDLLFEESDISRGVKAPPCRHCCNSSELHYRGYMRLVPSENEPRIGFVVSGRTPPKQESSQLKFISPPAEAPAAATPPAAAAPAEKEPALIEKLVGKRKK